MRQRLDRDYFEKLYSADPDPWNFVTSDYERRKYESTLRATGDRTFMSALEVGCSIGVFTQMLAPRCERLLALDASERAVESARERLGHLPNVTVERRTLPEQMPEGSFDLVVASEVLYYLPQSDLVTLLDVLEAAMRPGSMFVAVHWRKETETYPQQGDEVHEHLLVRPGLRHIMDAGQPEYRLDVFECSETGGAA